MTYTDEEALELALDAAAPDKGAWVAGQDAFYNSLSQRKGSEQAFHDALDAAAPDGESWQRGELVLLTHGKVTNHNVQTPKEQFTALKTKTVKTARNARDTIKSLLTQRSDTTGKE